MMNKAASELAFSDFTESKEAFLEKLAAVYWGKEKEKVAAAWRKFEEGYSLFPVNVAFTWFGPMTDAIVWPLHLEPVDLPVSSNWMLDDEVGTDRVGEFLAQGHNLEDAIVLCETMYRCMTEGVQLLEQAKHCGREERTEQLSVARALALLFESGTDIMRFYQLRNQLAYAAAVAANMFDPDVVVLGGEVLDFGDIHFEEFKKHFNMLSQSHQLSRGAVVQRSKFGRRGVAVGGAQLILDELIN
jgi:hypothetical protein